MSDQDADEVIEMHKIRVTSGSKIRHLVSFALEAFEKHPDQPILFHTHKTKGSSERRGDDPPPPPTTSAKTATPQTQEAVGGTAKDDTRPSPKKRRKTDSSGALDNATTVVPKLLSIVEIVKREYLKARPSTPGKDAVGLHQYNVISYLEVLHPGDADGQQGDSEMADVDADQARMDALALTLEGKNFLKQKFTPYMTITLSTSPLLPGLVDPKATYQPPPVRRASKAAKARAKKREKKLGLASNDPTAVVPPNQADAVPADQLSAAPES